MAHRFLAILAEKPGFPIKGNDRKILETFVEYLDHNSLFLLGYDNSEDTLFTFTNEAQHFTFSMSEIRKYYHDMKSGIPMDWEKIPFEYISKS
jgi:hypothetical protein